MKTVKDLLIQHGRDTGVSLPEGKRLAGTKDVRRYIHWLEEKLLEYENK